ncbi:homoserine kinase [Metabacillus arenae]|uniref:Homoserine kinase n=1 Tax=Metabacillus arenae TaxID=2771434 RepID=A0A926NN21_9BACI|nr:homoserine kinase [Metabacillus arenae]MBD1380826.1 homoserine kinase [Metabacillus arenae]
MTEGDMLKITVPGSTANLGPGFDSIGLALNCYLTMTVSPNKQWEFVAESEMVKDIPSGKENLVYQVAKFTADKYKAELPPCKVYVWSDIPLARGLGSSAAAVIGGIELANQLAGLNLSDDEKVRLSSEYEGHPDNVGASLLGGLVIGLHQEDETELVHIPNLDVDVIAIIPSYEVFTKDARDVLPGAMPYSKAVEASAVSNLLVAALLTKNWGLVGKMMSRDLFHQPYRQSLVPELAEAEKIARAEGAYGVALSGAGPTILCLTRKENSEQLAKTFADAFPECEVKNLGIAEKGCYVESVGTVLEKGGLS